MEAHLLNWDLVLYKGIDMDNEEFIIHNEKTGALIQELICPYCMSELRQISWHICQCPGCGVCFGSFKANEQLIQDNKFTCIRCEHRGWMVQLPSDDIQCPLCDIIYPNESTMYIKP